VIGLVLLGPLAAGCATFKASKRLDVGPFAENTVGMIGEVQRVTTPVSWAHLKKYDGLPSVQEVRRAYQPARVLLRGVALYSTQVVSVYESDLAEPRKVEELSRYLDGEVRARLAVNPSAELFLTQTELDAAVSRVKSATSFMGALGEAQPVVSAALSYGNWLYDSLDVKIQFAAADLDARIEQEFAPVKEQMETLTGLQLGATREYTLLARYRLGNNAALDSLRAEDPEVAEVLPAGKRPGAASLDAVEKRLLSRFETIGVLRAEIEKQFEAYQASQQEMVSIRNQALEAARLGRITLILWTRSHRNLATGITVPAAINMMGLVTSAAGKAASVVVP
jgi:hypothetical protein